MLMRSVSRCALALSLALAVPAIGCGGGVTSEPVASADSATTRAPVAQNVHGPMLKMVGDALGQVPLTAGQRAQIEKLAADAEARHADARAAQKDLMLAIAAQVQAGSIDRAALQPKIDTVSAALAKAQPADRASFEQLHALLSADQRAAFVDAVQAGAHEHMAGKQRMHPLKQWAEDLQLTDAQKTQIRTAMRERLHAHHGGDGDEAGEGAHEHGPAHPWAEGARHGAKVLEAFKQDRFVMDEVAPAHDVTKMATRASDRMLGLAETVLPILTPEQRALAAQKLRAKADSDDPNAF